MTITASKLNVFTKAKIIELVADGMQFVDISAQLNLSSTCIPAARANDPLFDEELGKAREYALHNFVDSLITIADECETLTEVSIARLKSDNIKWTASKIIPRVYGDQIQVNHQHSIDLTKILAAAESRVIPILKEKQAIEDAEVIEVIDELL